jgi:Tol biopolymer transport system component
MKTRNLLIGLGVLIGVVIISLIIIPKVAEPEIVTVFPEDGANHLSPGTAVEIHFSNEMDWDSVIERITFAPRIEGKFSFEGKTIRFTPENDWPAGETVVFNLAAGATTNLNIELTEDAYWSFQIWDIHLAYLWPSDMEASLFMLKPGSEEPQQLTGSEGVLDFDVGVDTDLIYYSLLNSEGGSDIWQLSVRNSENQVLIECGEDTCSEVQVSADNSKLAYVNTSVDGSLSVWTFDLADSSAERISQEGGTAHMPQWSSAGFLSYYDFRNFRYYIVDLESGSKKYFENFTGEPGAWSPDGLLFVTVEYSLLSTTIGKEGELDPEEEFELETVFFTSSQMMAYEVSTGKRTNLSGDTLVEDDDPVFSPDGNWLVFSRRILSGETITPGRQLWLMRADGSQAQQITDEPEYKYMDFAWHPNSEQVAAVRASNVDRTEPTEIWLFDLRTDEAVEIMTEGFQPEWIE